ncbi:MAG: hypothetical protein OXH20_03900 [bacterium]|nr:hypothetical protein [bacterium]MXZ30281.1 hypothetical protein [Acidimicrobiia bacterium]MYE67315.1 hypothetical protein [Acidimicrobiia bacterium]
MRAGGRGVAGLGGWAGLAAGRVVAYSAASSDEGVASVSVSGSVMAVTGVGAGSATVTYTAKNAGGGAGSSLAVTVSGAAAEPPKAPTLAEVLAARTVVAGSTATVDAAAGFAGVVESFAATSSDQEVLTVSVAGSVVTLAGVSPGAVTVTVVAANAAGSASRTFDVSVTPRLAVAATAPAYCLTGEGRPVAVAATVGREGVASVPVTYTISGGRGPYTVIVGDAGAGTLATAGPAAADRLSVPTASSRVAEVSCARPGVNLKDVGARVNVVEAGAKTIGLLVTDAAGASAAATVTVQVAEDVYTTAYNGGTMRAGRTYVLGDADVGRRGGLLAFFGAAGQLGSCVWAVVAAAGAVRGRRSACVVLVRPAGRRRGGLLGCPPAERVLLRVG